MTLFSVIIPVYNRPSLIQRAIDSVLKQEQANYELIVVDDGSTDGTRDVVRNYGDAVRLIEQENAGPGAARNRGIEAATGRYITFLDSDDQWFPWTLSTFAEAIRRHAEPSFIVGTNVDVDLGGNLEEHVEGETPAPYRAHTWPDYYTAAAQRVVWARPPSVAIDADVARSAGGFATKNVNAEDIDFWMKLGTAPGFAYVKEPPVSTYSRHDNSVMQDHEKTYRGIQHLVQQEVGGQYPGGASRANERRTILTRHTRSASMALLRNRHLAGAWDVYSSTLRWNARQGRWKYVAAFSAFFLWTTLGLPQELLPFAE